MKTAELIAALAAEAPAVPAGVIRNRLLTALAIGGLVALALVVFWLKPQPLGAVVGQGWFWMKLGYTAALAAAASAVVARLARPGLSAFRGAAIVVILIALMAILGLGQLALAEPEQRLALWLGRTWRVCPWNILLLSIPIFLALAWALKKAAPTHLVAAGAAAGLLSGGLAASLYCLHCPEQAASFVAFWYTLGMLLSTGLGALLGPRLLRW